MYRMSLLSREIRTSSEHLSNGCSVLWSFCGDWQCGVSSRRLIGSSSKMQHFSKCMLMPRASRFQPKGFALALESSTAASPAALGCASWLLHRQLGLPLSLLPALGWRLCRTLRFRASFGRGAGPQTPLDIAGRPHMITCKMWHARLRPCRVARAQSASSSGAEERHHVTSYRPTRVSGSQ